MSENPPPPDFHIEITYGEYRFIFTIDPLRKMSHVSVTGTRGQGLTNRMVYRDAAVAGMDFYLAGVEVFIQQALKELIKESGDKLPFAESD